MQVFFRRYQVSRILRAANAYKLRGIPVLSIFLLVFRMVFQQRSVYTQMHLQRTAMPFGKDTFYRFMNSCRIHWRRFTTELAAAIIHATLAPLTQADRINVLILDDSIYHRARSKKVELLARLYDHAKKEFSYGFRMLTLCWSDGNTLLPVSHTLLATENTKNRLREASRKVDARSNGGKQRKLAQQKATEVKAIYKQHRKRRGRSKYLLSVEAAVVKGEESLPVRLVFVRNRNHRKDWLVLVTTDMSLTAEEVIRIYGKRWGIEVFFKVCKSFLRLEKDCRSLSYDAMTAHVSIVFTRYMFLAVEQRECKDARSLGELFYLSVDELSDVCFVEAMRLLLLLFVERLQEKPMLDEGEIQGQLQGFLKELPVLLSQKLRKCA
ncbi:transposase [Selenomonas sputigena]|uniref:transposase n=1 Tax=Selenomonas sputigena TaxID=69823 RepID=UPI002232754B|nr:transposase [Selenomonas sputigena]UZD42236.1 transposase [Selenomonas sputigena]